MYIYKSLLFVILEASILRSKCQHGQVLVKGSLLGYKWLSSFCVLTRKGEGRKRKRESFLMSLLIKKTKALILA
jgi:hypothetical protein